MINNHLRILKLINGDAVIGFVKADTQSVSFMKRLLFLKRKPTFWFLKNAMQITIATDAETRKDIVMLHEWIPYTKQVWFPIQKSQIIAVAIPSNEMQEYYLSFINPYLSELERCSTSTSTPDAEYQQLLANFNTKNRLKQ